MSQRKFLTAVLVSLVALPLAAAAQSAGVPDAKSANGVKYVAGGVGKPESQAMFKEAARYPLNLVFSGGKDKHFVSDVRVHVKNAAGKTVFETTAAAPIMLVDLPAGKYTVEAQYRGKTQQQTAEVALKRATGLSFNWDRAD